MYEQTQKVQSLENENSQNKTVQQTLMNLKPKNGMDGNCKRCEALIVVNGTYIQKIKDLKRKVKQQ